MKCDVCGKEFTGAFCPRCDFPVVESTNVDALLDEIQKYRQEFYNSIYAEIYFYYWKEEDGSVVLDRRERKTFGRFPELCGKVTWLPQQLARIPEAKNLDLSVCITSRVKTNECTVSVPNLLDSSLQQIGIEVKEDLCFRLKLRNDLGGETASEWTDLL